LDFLCELYYDPRTSSGRVFRTRITPGWFFRLCIILTVNWGGEVREVISKGIGRDILYARGDLWKNTKECGTRIS
jgi:hypothetical protein